MEDGEWTMQAQPPPISIAHPPSSNPTRLRRQYLLAALLTLAIVLPRTLSVQRAHSESWDDQYHLLRGMYYWYGEGFDGYTTLPPLGEGIVALPMVLSGCTMDGPQKHPDYNPFNPAASDGVLYGQHLSPETLLYREAIWKSILFLPGALLVFHIGRKLYGLPSAWLAIAMLLSDPTIAAHVAPTAVDMVGMFLIVAAVYAQWNWSMSPTPKWMILACIATAAAMLTHTIAVVLPLLAIGFAVLNQYVFPQQKPRRIRPVLTHIGLAALVTLFCIWAFTLFDISRPVEHCALLPARYEEHWSWNVDVINANLTRHLPAGTYIASLVESWRQAAFMPGSWILGEIHPNGAWFYYFVLATYKIPIGIAIVLVVGLASLVWKRFAWDECLLLIPLLLFLLLLSQMTTQPGPRHGLSAYLMAMMLASRSAAAIPSLRAIAWGGVVIAAVHSVMWHPNYLSYVNWPREKVWLQIGDSSLDWGQALKQIRDWIDTHAAGREDVYLIYEGNPSGFSQKYYLGHRVRELAPGPLPATGLLIISPVYISGARQEAAALDWLRDHDPIAIIGDCILVFDLSKLPAPPPSTTATKAETSGKLGQRAPDL